MNTKLLDQVTLVNDKDKVVGSMDKVEAHRGEGQLHRAVSVYLYRPSLEGRTSSPTVGGHDKRGVELLIQQRSDQKIVGAHQWANTICGNVRPTESYEQCAHRRLREELGITANYLPSLERRTSSPTVGGHDKWGAKLVLEPIYKFRYQLQCNADFSENEIDQVFIGWYDGEVIPNPDEVQECAWVDWEKLVTSCQLSVIRKDNFNTKVIQLPITNYQSPLTLAPWFVHMLGDEELIKKIEQFIKK